MTKKRERGSTIFEQKTTEATWAPEGDSGREYKLRYIHAEDCCSPDSVDHPEWPSFSLPTDFEYYGNEEREDATDDEEKADHPVLGAIWTSEGLLVAAWVYQQDSHVELFGKKDYEFIDDLEHVTRDLCVQICPEMCDVFDDGSGTTREVTKVLSRLLVCETLDGLYAIPPRESE